MNRTTKKQEIINDFEMRRIPPQAIDAEEQILGILMGGYIGTYPIVAQLIETDCFYKEHHQFIFDAISEIENAGNKADPLTVMHQLRKNGTLDQVGGAYYLTQLLLKVSSPMQLEQYCIIVKEKYLYRKLIEISNNLLRDAYSEDTDVFELYSNANETLSKAISMSSDTIFTIEDAIKGVCEQINRNCAGEHQLTGIPTGFYQYDKRSGGLQGSDLVIIAAETSQGKTSLATSIARNASLKGAKIAFYSLEMTKEQLAARLMAIETNIPANELLYSRMTQQKIMHLHQNISNLLNTNIYFDERSTNNIENILSSIRSLKMKYAIDVVIVDYLQLVSSNKRGANREQQVADVARSLKNIAKELNINVILLSQLSRGQGDPCPKMSRLRDSGQIEEAADVVMFIYRPEAYNRTYPRGFEDYPVENTAMIEVAKGRHIGLLKFIVNFNAQTTHFLEYEEVLNIPRRTEETDPFLTI